MTTHAQATERQPESVTPGGAQLTALKPYDVRHDNDRGRRRHLAQRTRLVLRLGTLVGLDLLAAVVTLRVALIGAEQAFTPGVLAAVLPVAVLSFLAVHAYDAGRPRLDAYARFVGVLLIGVVLAVQLSLLQELGRVGPVRLLLVWLPLLYAVIELKAALVQRGVQVLRRRTHLMRPTLVVGTGSELQQISSDLSQVPEVDLLPVGHVPYSGEDSGAIGRLDTLEDLIHEQDIRVVVLAESVPEQAVPTLIARIFDAGAAVMTMPSRAQREAALLAGHPPLDPAQMEFRPPQLRMPQLGIKRALDLTLTVTALLLLSPVLIAVAIAIRLDSPGPVLFRQVRVGLGGRTFEMLKFRTMVLDAEARKPALAHLNQYQDGLLFKIPDDPRITRMGRWLRRTSIDELPQLFNVLQGRMSLVGPRPPVPSEVAIYSKDHFVRLTVTPGVTGPWQVNGRNNVRSLDDVVNLEHDYIRNWSLAVDLRILARTIRAVITRDGAH